jgi:hypothetical protein
VVVENGELKVERGSGKYIARGTPEPIAAASGRMREGPAQVLRKLIG